MSAFDPVDGSFSATRVPGTWALLRLPRSSSRASRSRMFDEEAVQSCCCLPRTGKAIASPVHDTSAK
jgi:hypothetical protein